MKLKHFLSIVCMVLVLFSCSENPLPRPVIKFTDTPATLKAMEKNKLINEDVTRNNPDAKVDGMGYIQQWETYKYLTEQGDTITYWYMRGQVFDVLVEMPNITLDELAKKIETEFGTKANGNGVCDTKDYFIKFGKDGTNKGCYILYFYPCDEIRDIFELFYKPSSAFGYDKEAKEHLERCSGKDLQAPILLGLSGRADLTGPVGYYSNITHF